MGLSASQVLQKAEDDLQKATDRVELKQAEMERARVALADALEHQTKMQAAHEWVRQALQDQPEESEQAERTEPISVSGPQESIPGFSQDQAESSNLIPARFGKPVPEVSQTELCLYALNRLDRAVTTAEVREFLQQEGHDYNQAQIRATLKYLANRRKPSLVDNIQPGVWRLRPVGGDAHATPVRFA